MIVIPSETWRRKKSLQDGIITEGTSYLITNLWLTGESKPGQKEFER